MRVENMVFLDFSIANGKEKCKINFEQIERYCECEDADEKLGITLLYILSNFSSASPSLFLLVNLYLKTLTTNSNRLPTVISCPNCPSPIRHVLHPAFAPALMSFSPSPIPIFFCCYWNGGFCQCKHTSIIDENTESCCSQ